MHQYEQSTGVWACQVGSFQGYSGAPGHVNVGADQFLENLGPIPCGWYTIVGPPYDDPHLGKFVMRLEPDANTDCGPRQRDTFRLHGDNASRPPRSSSEGCIVQGPVARHYIADLVAKGDNRLQVVPVL